MCLKGSWRNVEKYMSLILHWFYILSTPGLISMVSMLEKKNKKTEVIVIADWCWYHLYPANVDERQRWNVSCHTSIHIRQQQVHGRSWSKQRILISHGIWYAMSTTCLGGRCKRSCMWMVLNREKTSLHSTKNSYRTVMKTVTKDIYSKTMLSIPKSYTNYAVIFRSFPKE